MTGLDQTTQIWKKEKANKEDKEVSNREVKCSSSAISHETMKTVLDSLCGYRRYCWNQGLELWNTLYEQRLISLPDELRAKIKASLTDGTPIRVV